MMPAGGAEALPPAVARSCRIEEGHLRVAPYVLQHQIAMDL
jgi:hypothetical protein